MTALIEHWTLAGPIKSALTLEQIEQEEAHAAATVGAATPLGLVTLATALFTWSTVTAGWWPVAAGLAAVPLLVIFGGLAQFIAAMWSYRKGNTFEATWFGSMGGFFAVLAVYFVLDQVGTFRATPVGAIDAVMFGCFAFIALFLAIAALRVNIASFLVLILLAASLALLMVDGFIGSKTVLGTIGGWCGIASAVVAFYTAAAMVINSVNMGPLLPLGTMRARG